MYGPRDPSARSTLNLTEFAQVMAGVPQDTCAMIKALNFTGLLRPGRKRRLQAFSSRAASQKARIIALFGPDAASVLSGVLGYSKDRIAALCEQRILRKNGGRKNG